MSDSYDGIPIDSLITATTRPRWRFAAALLLAGALTNYHGTPFDHFAAWLTFAWGAIDPRDCSAGGRAAPWWADAACPPR